MSLTYCTKLQMTKVKHGVNTMCITNASQKPFNICQHAVSIPQTPHDSLSKYMTQTACEHLPQNCLMLNKNE